MPRFSINASMMLTEWEFPDRFQAAADLGFAGVDIQFPYAFEADAIAARLAAAGVEPVLINVPAGDLTSGGDGLACVPGREAAFAAAVEEARAYALAIGASRVNVLSGRLPAGCAPARARAVLVDNLRLAADRMGPDGIIVMIEPCNAFDVERYFVNRTADAVAIIEEAGRPNLAVQYDFYHRQMTEGRVLDGFAQALPHIAHVQFADVPGRHEPGTGELDFRRIFAAIDASAYAGWVAAEYLPSRRTGETLAWMTG